MSSAFPDPTRTHDERALTPRAFFGLLIIVAGVLLLLDRIGIAPAGAIVRQYWPLILVAVGGLLVLQNRRPPDADGRRGGSVNGVIVIVIGGWLLLNTTGVTSVHFWDLFWPAVLIVVGVLLVTQARRRTASGDTVSDDRVSIFAVLGGVKRGVDTRQFTGGEITAFMGGCNLDLRQATIPPGTDAVLDVMAVMGGCEIAVPPSWAVATQIVPIMGGIEDKRLPPLPGPEPSAPPSRLVLRGIVFMGGLEIKS